MSLYWRFYDAIADRIGDFFWWQQYKRQVKARACVAAEDRAGEVAFRGEEHVAELEAEANT